jgi:predicted ATPase/DNA-binding SARP family transcriptional activator
MMNVLDPAPPTLPRIAIKLFGSFEIAREQSSDLRTDDQNAADDHPSHLFGTSMGTSLRLPTRKIESLLAYLVLHPETHSREKTAALFWGDVPDAQARVSLRYALAMLRKELGGDLVITDRETVQLNPEFPLWVDARAFSQITHRVSQNTDMAAAIRDMQSATSQYRGDLLADFYDDWILPERELYRQAYLDTLLHLTQHYRSTSEYARAVETAQRVLETDPANERAHQHLMFCFVALGNRHAALQQYAQCVRALREQLAVDPAPETTALYETLKQASGESLSSAARLSNLPIPLTSFIGREQEMTEVKELLTTGDGRQSAVGRPSSIITLTGAGGSGKTRLAIQVATDLLDAYRDGVWWVELAGLADGALVAQAVEKALGLQESTRQPVKTLTNFLRDKQLLLVLDNCEHLLDACAHLARTLLGACPHLQILATSREPLGFIGETVRPISTFAFPEPNAEPRPEVLLRYEAVRLFVERARAVYAAFALTAQNASAVAQICARLDGIPLALELAAARVYEMSVHEIAARLDDRFNFFTRGNRGALPRQQTLYALMDWSHTLLSDMERVLFRRLSVFAGGLTLDAATAIGSDDGVAPHQVQDLVLNLARKSLLNVTREGTTRYVMLETIREYAEEKLAESGEHNEFKNRHSDYFLDFAERVEPKIKSAERPVWAQRYHEEHENIQAALRWAIESNRDIRVELPTALFRFWLFRGHFAVGRKWMEQLLASPQGARPEIRARALITAGELAAWINDTRGIEMLEEALPICRELGDKKGTALALQWLGVNYAFRYELDRARNMSEESAALFRELGDVWLLGESTCWRGQIALLARDIPRSLELSLQGAKLLAESGDIWDTACPRHRLARIAYFQGDYAAAQDKAMEALRLFSDVDDTGGVGIVAGTVGQIARARGDYTLARQFYQQSLQMKSAEQEEDIGRLHSNLGFVEFHLGNLKNAAEEFETSFEIARKTGSKGLLTCCLIGFAMLAAANKQLARAAQLLGAASSVRDGLRDDLEPADGAEYDSVAAELQRQMQAEAFDAAWAEGRSMTLEQTLHYARERISDWAADLQDFQTTRRIRDGAIHLTVI